MDGMYPEIRHIIEDLIVLVSDHHILEEIWLAGVDGLVRPLRPLMYKRFRSILRGDEQKWESYFRNRIYGTGGECRQLRERWRVS
jgi:hypothetical protein